MFIVVTDSGVRCIIQIVRVLTFGTQKFLFQTVVLRVLVHKILFDSFDCISVQLTARSGLFRNNRNRIVLDHQVVNYYLTLELRFLLLITCQGHAASVWFGVCWCCGCVVCKSVFVKLNCMVVEVSFKFTQITNFFLMIVSFAHTRMCFRYMATQCWTLRESFWTKFAFISELRHVLRLGSKRFALKVLSLLIINLLVIRGGLPFWLLLKSLR